MTKKETIISLICNIANAVLTAVSVLRFFISRGDGNMAVSGSRAFRFFTVDSNILAALASVCLICFCIGSLWRNGEPVPVGTAVFKFVGTSAITLTLMTVLLFLGPTMGYGTMFVGSSLYMHLINPLLCIITFVLVEKGPEIPLKYLPLGVLPTLLYGAVYIVMAVASNRWPDFYGFNRGGMWYISLPVMTAASVGIAYALLRLRNYFCRRS